MFSFKSLRIFVIVVLKSCLLILSLLFRDLFLPLTSHIFLCSHISIVILDWKLDTVNFTLLDVSFRCLPLRKLDFNLLMYTLLLISLRF